jgi:hypothetical protein
MGHTVKRGDAYRVLVGKLEGKISLGRSRSRWKHNIKTGLYQIGWGSGLGWSI